MIIFLLILVLSAVVYTGYRTLTYLKLFFPQINKKECILYCVIYFLLMVMAGLSMGLRGSPILVGIRNAGFIWMAIFLYLFFGCLIYEIVWPIIKYILKKIWNVRMIRRRLSFAQAICAGVILGLSLLVSIFGIFHAGRRVIKEYSVTIEKDCELDLLRVVMVSDLHLGSKLDLNFVQKLTKEINELNPDIICIAGDIFDNDYEALLNPESVIQSLKTLKSKYGVYACLGNHDIDHLQFNRKEQTIGHEKIAAFLEAANIVLLEDEIKLIEDTFYIAGRKDKRPLDGGEHNRLSVSQIVETADKTKPILLLDHRPEEVKEASNSGVDLIMCGHTHKGQVFPGNLIVKLTTDYSYGHYNVLGMDTIVSSGAGYWGPPCRVATNCEIVVIEAEFKK